MMEFLKDAANPFSMTLGIVIVLYMALKTWLSHLNKGYKKTIELKDNTIQGQAKTIKHLTATVTRYKKLLK